MGKFRKLLKDNAAFTLIELLVVIAVLGILAGITVPRITGVQDKAKIAAGQSALRSIYNAVEMYRTENTSSTPSALSDLDPYLSNPDEVLGDWSGSGFDGGANTSSSSILVVTNGDLELTLHGNGNIEDTSS